MTRVLVITDNERVQRVFDGLRGDKSLQVSRAGTLSEGDEEITAAVPDSVFLQSRISGFSGEIVMRHLKKTLPATTKVTLLAVDPEDAAHAKRRKIPVVELWADDEGLKDQLHSAVSAGGRKQGAKGRVADRRKTSRKGAAAPAAEAVQAAVPEPPAEEMAQVPPVPTPGAEAPSPPPVASITKAKKPPVADEVFTEATESPVEEQPVAEADETEPEPEATSFAELMRRAAAKRAPATPAEVEDQVKLGAAQPPLAEKVEPSAAAGTETAENAPSGFTLAEPPEQEPERHEERPASGFVPTPPPSSRAFVLAEEPEEEQPSAAGGYPRGESVAEAYLRTKGQKQKRPPYWILPLAVVLVAIPAALYFTKYHQRSQPAKVVQQPARPQGAQVPAAAPAHAPAPAKAPVAPAPAGTVPARPSPTPAPAGTAPAKGPSTQAPVAAVPAAKPPAPPAARQAPPAGPAPRQAPPAPQAGQAPGQAPAAPQAGKPPRQAPAAAPATAQRGAAPTTSPAAPPANKQRAAQGATPAPQAPKTLPPFITGAKLDPAYGKSHPGWVRYIGPRAQYRLYRQGDNFKALQVIPLGGNTVPDQIYQRALLEFGGIDSYQLQSSDSKGKYVVEQGVAKGGVGVTIYRNKSDLAMKGLVIYYR